jgi:hypothetical protein
MTDTQAASYMALYFEYDQQRREVMKHYSQTLTKEIYYEYHERTRINKFTEHHL